MRVAADGVSVDLPPGWEARIARTSRGDGTAQPVEPGAPVERRREVSPPILHAATVPLPAERGDYGSSVVELLGPTDVFVALVDMGAEVAGRGLYRLQGLPDALSRAYFSPDRLQRAIPGQLGTQAFFTEGGRGWALYVVLGSQQASADLLRRVSELLAGVAIDALPEGPR